MASPVAVYIDPCHGKLRIVPWNLQEVPHQYPPYKRSTTYLERVDSRNCTLAMRVLHLESSEDIAPYLVYETEDSKYILWVHDNIATDEESDHGFRLVDFCPTITWFKPAVLVCYSQPRDGVSFHQLFKMSTEAAELVTGQPKIFSTDSIYCEFVYGRRCDYFRGNWVITCNTDDAQLSSENVSPKYPEIWKCVSCGAELTRESRKRCSRCKVVFYCGEDCQRQHWSVHKTQCRQFSPPQEENTL